MPAATQTHPPAPYRGRIAPTPSGWLHLGHAMTFGTAWQRARAAGGTLLLRIEDLDPARCRQEYAVGALEDLSWWGLRWDEGPDLGGPHAPYFQSGRLELFRKMLARLQEQGLAYASIHSRAEVELTATRCSPVDGESIFPPEFRPQESDSAPLAQPEEPVNWRFRVPDGKEILFMDQRLGVQAFTAGADFGDFIVWKKDGFPAYELAVVADDHAMGITEVVRGEDLLLSTARQLLLYEAMGWEAPQWYHCALVEDPATGRRMSKTHRSLSLRELRAAGYPPGQAVKTYLNPA